jgi:hypothetical protein
VWLNSQLNGCSFGKRLLWRLDTIKSSLFVIHYHMRAFYIVIFAAIFAGCQSLSLLDQGDFDAFLQRASHSQKQTGDFGAFFAREIAHFGGRAAGTTVPVLRGTWYSESDDNGFAVQLYDIPFSQVQSFLQQAYGQPIAIYTNATPNAWSGLYGIPHGVAVQVFSDTNGIGFICMQSRKKT